MTTLRISSIRGTGGDGTTNLVGPTTIFVGTDNTYTITDYDDFSVYELMTSVGEVTRVGDIITLSIPPDAVGESVALSVNKSGSIRVFQIGLGGTGVVTPSISSPPNGVSGVPTTATIQGSAFRTVPVGAGVHTSSQWQVARDAGFTDIVSEGIVDSGNLTRYTAYNLPRNTTFYVRVRYISDIGDSGWSSTSFFTTVDQQINQPTLSIVGGDFDVQDTPTFTSSTFSTSPADSDTHVASNWVLRDALTEDIVWQLINSTSNKVSLTLPRGVLEEDTLYTMEVQYTGGFGTSLPSERLTFQTAQSFIPEPGTPFGGGYYAGRIQVDGQVYALVVAPKAQGGESSTALQWRTINTPTSGTSSRNNGRANTNNMLNADHPAAQFCNSLSINGYDDWYLPARDELEILYRYLKPSDVPNQTTSGANPNSVPPTDNYTSGNPSQTSAAIFHGGSGESFITNLPYWSSTQQSSPAFAQSYAQSFSNGNQSTQSPTTTYHVRAVRRVPV